MPFNPVNPDPTVPVVNDSIDVELERAKLEAKQQRRTTIGQLLDSAVDVLSDVLRTTDAKHENARIRAAELAVNLYVQSENGERQDRALDVQQKRLELEEAKLKLPGGPLFQQNNVYLQGNQAPVSRGTPEEEAQALLLRKQAQDALLASYLPGSPDETTDDSNNSEDSII